jgi:hypothetical protein
MLILKIGGAIFAIVFIWVGINLFNDHCLEKFRYSFFSKLTFCTIGIAEALIYLGNDRRIFVAKSGGIIMNGWAMMGIGIVVLCILIFLNFKNANFWYGLAGTTLQLPICAIVAPLAFISLAMYSVASFFALACGDENQREKAERERHEHDWYLNKVNPNGPNFEP